METPATPLSFWLGFNLFVLAMLALDLGVFNKRPHAITIKESLVWSGVWVLLALIFNGFVWIQFGDEPALQFLTGYLLEKSLSMDNIFVFVLIFGYFSVPANYQHRVLFWGIIGALVLRAIFIFAGVALIERFSWTLYIFGIILLVTGVKMAFQKKEEINPEKNVVLNLLKRVVPITHELNGSHFFTKIDGHRVATRLFVVLVMVETTDIIFAVDSIPAILGVTQNAFIVYTSNVFAILGLRSLYFALAGVVQMFHLLHYGLAFILAFIGAKMLLAEVYHISVPVSLGVVVVSLVLSVVLSIKFPQKAELEEAAGAAVDAREET